jgi:hypothetical protein
MIYILKQLYYDDDNYDDNDNDYEFIKKKIINKEKRFYKLNHNKFFYDNWREYSPTWESSSMGIKVEQCFD